MWFRSELAKPAAASPIAWTCSSNKRARHEDAALAEPALAGWPKLTLLQVSRSKGKLDQMTDWLSRQDSREFVSGYKQLAANRSAASLAQAVRGIRLSQGSPDEAQALAERAAQLIRRWQRQDAALHIRSEGP